LGEEARPRDEARAQADAFLRITNVPDFIQNALIGAAEAAADRFDLPRPTYAPGEEAQTRERLAAIFAAAEAASYQGDGSDEWRGVIDAGRAA
jgi:hypothetical protein